MTKHPSISGLQKLANETILAMVNMKSFVSEIKTEMVPNTFGVKCPNCKVVDNVYAVSVQLRASDESSDRICVCLNCNYRWKITG